MLVELSIENFALIERATLGFGDGFNVISGETGAGKSLLIDALEFLLGERGKSGWIREGAKRARVEGCFRLTMDEYGSQVQEWLRDHLPETLEDRESFDEVSDSPSGELELILTRTLGADRRSRAHINHRPVTQRLLRELTAQLVEIHGQNDHQKLLEPIEQMRLVDLFANARETLARYREKRGKWLQCAEKLMTWREGEADRLQRLDLLRFQAQELLEAAPRTEEFEELLSEREKLRYSGDLGSELSKLCYDLSESELAAIDTLRRAERILDLWAIRIGSLEEPAQEMRAAVAHLDEALSTLQSFVAGVETDPQRLAEIEERIHLLQQLQRKYGTDMAGLAQRMTEIHHELDSLENEAAGSDPLNDAMNRAREDLEGVGKKLDSLRRKVRKKLERAVHIRFKELGLEGAQFECFMPDSTRPPADEGDFQALKKHFGVDGPFGVEFLLAANPGESPKPLREVASGGEMARIMLALRGALAVRRSTPTLIFDEVDTGVGGRLGPQLGRHLSGLAQHHQVLCVTHLPAIAAVADTHLKVKKSQSRGRTRTSVNTLDGESRVQEIADMIAGGADQSTARAEARRLLREI